MSSESAEEEACTAVVQTITVQWSDHSHSPIYTRYMRFCDAGERQESRSGESSAFQFLQVWYTYPVPCARVIVVPSTVQICTSIWSLRLRTPYPASPYESCYETLGPRADYHFRLEFNGRYSISTSKAPYSVHVHRVRVLKMVDSLT